MDCFFKNKFHYFIVLLLISLGSVSCSSHTVTQPYSYIDLYEVTERVCEVPDIAKDECNNTRFIELVKGQFFGVKNNEVAMVMWRGDEGEELLYQARKLDPITDDMIISGVSYISNKESEKETLSFSNGVVTRYKFEIMIAGKGGEKSRKIDYKLKPAKRGLLPDYRMNYPGND